MALTYEPIATTTLGTTANSITFSSIPSTYTDLRLIFVGSTTSNQLPVIFILNNDQTSLYSWTYLLSNGSGVGTNQLINQSSIQTLVNTGLFTSTGMVTMDIMNYAGSTFKSCFISAFNDLNGSGQTELDTVLYRSTSAINEIKIQLSSTYLFAIGTTATLYGIKAA